jgi:hypothetical protein
MILETIIATLGTAKTAGEKIYQAASYVREFRNCMAGEGQVSREADALLEKIAVHSRAIEYLITQGGDRAEQIYGPQLQRLSIIITDIVNQLHTTVAAGRIKHLAFTQEYLTTLQSLSVKLDSENIQMLIALSVQELALNTQQLQQLEGIIRDIQSVKERMDEQNNALGQQLQQLMGNIAQLKQEKEKEMNEGQVSITSEEEVKEVEGEVYGHKQFIGAGATPESIAAASRMAASLGNAPLPQRPQGTSYGNVNISLKKGAGSVTGRRIGNSLHIEGRPQQANMDLAKAAEPQHAEEKDNRVEKQQELIAQPPVQQQQAEQRQAQSGGEYLGRGGQNMFNEQNEKQKAFKAQAKNPADPDKQADQRAKHQSLVDKAVAQAQQVQPNFR